MRVAGHVTRTERAAVQEELHAFEVGVAPDVDLLSLAAAPVPVRKEVQDGVVAPPRLVVVEVVLREAADVQDAEVRVDARPFVGRRLAAVIEAGPDEAAGEPETDGVMAPPRLG